MFCVDVAINLPVKSIFKQFTYLAPARLPFLDVGWRVVVPFHGQTVEGFIVKRYPSPSDPEACRKLKEVEAALGDSSWFDREMLATAQWLSKYYMCSLAESMRLFVPGKTSIKRRAERDNQGRLLYYVYHERLQPKTVLAYAITEKGREALLQDLIPPRAKGQRMALRLLENEPNPLTVEELAELEISAGMARLLASRGWLVTSQKRVLRNSYRRQQPPSAVLQLTEEQLTAVRAIADNIHTNESKTFLLHGITGSGKTEVYLRAAAEALGEGKQVLVLVPEIALTAQLVERFQSWFGDNVAVAHSKLSQNERGDVWYRMRTGEAQVLIGVRSAVFAPFMNLGLIIIDEEHESSYKQDERPNYHAREVARARCHYAGATLVLGSATPDLVSYYAASQGFYTLLSMTRRPTANKLPQVDIVDMRKELAEKHFNVISRPLERGLQAVAEAGEQSIVLLNRRGYSTFVMCRDCGTSIVCPHCAVALVYHSVKEQLLCHYCGNSIPVPKSCPSCKSKRIKFFGTGTQKAEAELAALPNINVLRMDQDSTATKFAHEEILQQFRSGNYNTLIGTQMVAKGHDIPNVTMVGVLSADSALNLPDYRAGERTFALLTQAAGRAGRGEKPGHVYFQTYDPENRIIQQAAAQDYKSFAHEELEQRRLFFYPPFSKILKLTILDSDEQKALALAQKLVFYLQGKQLKGELQDLVINGPFPALVAKVRDLYRFNILLKASKMQAVKEALLYSEFREQPNLYFDVDPLNII